MSNHGYERTFVGIWGFIGGLVLAAVYCTALSVRPVAASAGPVAELRDVVGALKDLTAEVHAVAEGVRGLERALKEAHR